MKHLPALLLAAVLLAGCAAPEPDSTTAPAPEEAAATTAPAGGLYEPGSPLETATQGAVRVYPLDLEDAQGLLAWGDGLLLFSGTERTTLTVLKGDTLYPAASLRLDFLLSPEEPSVQLQDGSLSYYDPQARQTVVLDSSLKPVSHIAAPEDMVGAPLLSEDRNALYYRTASEIRCWDLETGIRRRVKESLSGDYQLVSLIGRGMVLQCTVTEGGQTRTLFLSAETGQLLHEQAGEMEVHTRSSLYFACFPTGMTEAVLIGEDPENPRALTPIDLSAACTLLPDQAGAVTASAGEADVVLDYYDLGSGQHRSRLTLTDLDAPLSVTAIPGDGVYLLTWSEQYGCQVICRWDTGRDTALSVSDSTSYLGTYYTAQAPDYDGLTRCRDYAQQISQRRGVEVLVWEDALAVQPWDYDFEAEYLTSVLEQELELLDRRLSNFPEGVLEQTASHFTGLTFSLVRRISGSPESGSLDTAVGIQFFDEAEGRCDAYVVLAAGTSAEKALYHELFHVMETHILTESIALDQWNDLNPSGFDYDYDYTANANREAGVYLNDTDRAFIDTYSMSFPKEDRARIFEYAMTPGNESLFQSDIMQAKLSTLCQGIREAYDLEDSEETFLWEQYLK